MNTVLLGSRLLLCCVEHTHFDFVASFLVNFSRSRFPFGLKSLAVTAPRSIELNQPRLTTFNDLATEVGISQSNDLKFDEFSVKTKELKF